MKESANENPANITLIERYADATWLRTTITAIGGALGIPYPALPVVVSTVDIALTAKAQQIAERRLNALCLSWQQQVEQMQHDAIDEEYLESEEFFDLILRAWEATKRTRSNDKIHLYARVLSGAIVFQDRNEKSPEDYLSVLEELSPNEIEVARALYRQQLERPRKNEFVLKWLERIGAVYFEEEAKLAQQNGEQAEHGNGQWKKLALICPFISYADINFILLRLERNGLIYEVNGTITNYDGGIYVITETFRKLMAYLEPPIISDSKID